MKPNDIERYLRNQTTPQARLAAWQNTPIQARLRQIRDAKYSGDTMRERRRALASMMGPELSAPDADTALYWAADDSALTLCEEFDPCPFEHTGWYVDEYRYEMIRPAIAPLPGSVFRKLVFPAASHSDADYRPVYLAEAVEVDFEDCTSAYNANAARREAEIEALRLADRCAELSAEEEREYRIKNRAEMEAEEARDERKALADTVRALASELRSAPPLPPTVCAVVREKLQSVLARRQELWERADTLAHDPYSALS
jgi:hypothetical protein